MYLLHQKKQIRHNLYRCGKKLVGLTDSQEKNAQLTFEKGSRIIGALVHLRFVEKTDEEIAMDHLQSKNIWALMRDHFRKCTRKGIVDTENRYGENIYCEGCVDRWEKMTIAHNK